MKHLLAVFIFLTINAFAAEKILKVGTESNYPPFSLRENGVLTGFEIELIKDVGRRLGMKIEFQDMAFDNLLFAAKSGQVQVIAAGLSPTPERAKQILFSKPFIKENPLMLISLKAHPITSIAQLKGKQVIVNDGYFAATYVATQKELTALALPTPVEAILALKAKRAPAYIVIKDVASRSISKQDADLFVMHDLPVGETNAFGVSKKAPAELLPQIDAALAQMEKDGSLVALKKKWQLQ